MVEDVRVGVSGWFTKNCCHHVLGIVNGGDEMDRCHLLLLLVDDDDVIVVDAGWGVDHLFATAGPHRILPEARIADVQNATILHFTVIDRFRHEPTSALITGRLNRDIAVHDVVVPVRIDRELVGSRNIDEHVLSLIGM